MRIKELSDLSGITVPTIKYYLREGLVPRGVPTGPNQARYDDSHVQRLRLIRTLVEVGGLPMAAIKKILDAAGRVEVSASERLYAVRALLTARMPPAATAQDERETHDFLARRGYHIGLDDPAAASLATVLTAARQLGHDGFTDLLDAYADECERLAERVPARPSPDLSVDDLLRVAVIETVVSDAAIIAIRQIIRRADLRSLSACRR